MQERKSERIEVISADGTAQRVIYDLSKTGLSCFCPKPKDKNSYVVVKINDLILRAKVIYCQKREKNYRLGLQFWNVLPERQVKLNDLVDKYSKGVPINCTIVEDTSVRTPQLDSQMETKRIITKNILKKKST